jgi:hypothetical protein
LPGDNKPITPIDDAALPEDNPDRPESAAHSTSHHQTTHNHSVTHHHGGHDNDDGTDFYNDNHYNLTNDYYAMAYLAYKKDVCEEHKLSKDTQARMFYSCCWIFLIEVILVYMIIKTVVFDTENFSISTPTVEVYLCRFICSLLLHMELISNV